MKPNTGDKSTPKGARKATEPTGRHRKAIDNYRKAIEPTGLYRKHCVSGVSDSSSTAPQASLQKPVNTKIVDIDAQVRTTLSVSNNTEGTLSSKILKSGKETPPPQLPSSSKTRDSTGTPEQQVSRQGYQSAQRHSQPGELQQHATTSLSPPLQTSSPWGALAQPPATFGCEKRPLGVSVVALERSSFARRRSPVGSVASRSSATELRAHASRSYGQPPRLDDLKILDVEALPTRAALEIKNSMKTIQKVFESVNFTLDFYTMDTAEYINGNNTNVSKYLLAAREYCPVVNIEEPAKSVRIVCSICKNERFDINGTTYICRDCGNQREVCSSSHTSKDPVRVNTTLRYTYKRRSHFRDCVNQYQGKQNTTIPPDLLETLKRYADMYNLNTDGNYSAVTKEHILMFLKDSDNTKYYEDVNLVYRLLTGNPVDDISYLEDAILRDFDILSDLYDKKFKPFVKEAHGGTPAYDDRNTFDANISRKSFINKHYILFQLLRRHGHPCKSDDFNILKTVDRKSLHEDILSKLFDELGWNFTSLF
jgi:hypothetical protein